MKRLNLLFILFVSLSITINGKKLLAQTSEIPTGEGTEASPYQIANLNNLYWLSQTEEHWDKQYIQTVDIDASDTENWNGETGFNPIGTNYDDEQLYFTGIYNGDLHIISNLFINKSETNYVGLFGYIGEYAEIKNINLINVNITGNNYVGGLVGHNFMGYINNSYSTGNVEGSDYVGGFVGANATGGGISNSYSTSTVTGNNNVGGFIGLNEFMTVSNSYSTGTVIGNDIVGGFVGFNMGGDISNSYSTSNVTGNDIVGGFIGFIDFIVISNSYSTGSVIGNNNVGGLIGIIEFGGGTSNSYSTGDVTGDNNVGGLIGEFYGSEESISNSYWDIETSGQESSSGGTGKTTAEMQTQSTYVDWDFETIWNINTDTNNGYPSLLMLYSFNDFTSFFLEEQTGETSINNENHTIFIEVAIDTDLTNLNPEYTISENASVNEDFSDFSSMVTYIVTSENGDTQAWSVAVVHALEGEGTEANPYQIANLNNLYWLSQSKNYWDKHYIQTADIDASDTENWDNAISFTPVGIYYDPFTNGGSYDVSFTGVYNGDNHVISNLFISKEQTDYVGLFGYVSEGAEIKNIGVINVNITGNSKVGALVGRNYGEIRNSYSIGGTVTGKYSVGGLVGSNDNGSISNSYSTSNVTGESDFCGGFVGKNNSGTIINSYSAGNVTGESDFCGGFVGKNNSGTITNSYWDIETSGQENSDGATGETTTGMQTQSNFIDWDFLTIWSIEDNEYPKLRIINSNGIKEISQEENIKVFPNPAKGILNIQELPNNSDIYIVDILGKIIFHKKNYSFKDFKINTYSFNQGIYFVKIFNKNNVATKKITIK